MKMILNLFSGTKYLVTEETMVNVNDNLIRLHANEVITFTKNGVPKAISASDGGTELEDSDAVQNLIDQEILIEIEEESESEGE